jgi:hypothetical protein
MKTVYKWLGQLTASAGLLGVMLAASGSAMADTYNIILKGITPPECATGAFTYTHTPATKPDSYPVAPVITVLGQCFTDTEPVSTVIFNQNSTVQVVLENTTTPAGDQGSNVVGLAGSLSTSTTGNEVNAVFYTITFSSGPRLYSVTKTTGTGGNQTTESIVSNQPYDVRNTLSVPEPETLWLALAGLSALALSRFKRRRL